MDIVEALSVLKAVGTLTSTGKTIYDWLMKKQASGEDDSYLQILLNKLPINASADAIIQVVAPYYKVKGGDIHLKAGNDGGGDIHISGSNIEAGSGVGGGGEIVISGGNGGPNGKGGIVKITNSTFKGGAAK